MENIDGDWRVVNDTKVTRELKSLGLRLRDKILADCIVIMCKKYMSLRRKIALRILLDEASH